jgi:acetylornithine deacetylase/succinyl-diaminopimelate desuccinylase-like protein
MKLALFLIAAGGLVEAAQTPPNALRGKQALVASSVKSSGQQNVSQRTRFGQRHGVPEQIETWHDSGMGVLSALSDFQMTELVSGITAETYLAELHAIVDPQPSRFIADKGNRGSAEIIEKAFLQLGLQSEDQELGITAPLRRYIKQNPLGSLHPSLASDMPGGNIVGFMRGRDLSHEVVIVACHYDSVNWEDTTAASPGVDDNGSGCALMLLTAKAFSQAAVKPRRSLLFVAFNAEEEGLVGSLQFAKLFAHGGPGHTKYGKPVGAIVADEVAWPGVGGGARKVIFETRGRGDATNTVVDSMAHANDHGDGVDGFVVNYAGFGSDHISLLDAGVPAVLLIERDNMYHADTWGHSARDTFDHVDAAFGAAVTRLAARAMAALANPAGAANATALVNSTQSVASVKKSMANKSNATI